MLEFRKKFKGLILQDEIVVICIFVIGLSFYLNLCYKKHKYRRRVFDSLVHMQETEKNKSIVKAAIMRQSNNAVEIENRNAKVMRYILPLNVLFLGYCSVAMANKYFIVFLLLVSVYMVAFIFDKTLNIKFNEAILKLLENEKV